jgi:hypothetical protein
VRRGLGTLPRRSGLASARQRGRAALRGLALGVLALGWAPAAWAASSNDIQDTDWRQPRAEELNPDADAFSPEHFAFELRFAPYWPEVDEELGSSPGPYESMFGTKARFYFGLELDWLPFRIPYIGTIGPSFGWGYTRSSGKAILVSTGQAADADTSLTILPMHFSAVLRGDYLLEKWRIPIVPYGKLGLGLGLWTASGAEGTSEVALGDGSTVKGQGTSLGMHLALGGMIALSAFDQESEYSMREDSGVQNAYVFGEWMWANLDGIGSYPQMHVGTSTAVFGLAIDW